MADKQRLPTKYKRPEVKECVRLTSLPINIGPKNPPRFPTELINPMDAAAADSPKKAVGTAQKQG
jgi:hypothetical protein